MKKTQDTARKRGLAPRALVADEGRRSTLASLDRPAASPAAAFVRAAIDALDGPAPAPRPTTTAGAAPSPAPAVTVPAARSPAERVLVRIPVASVDLTRRRFQYRVSRNLARLQESLLLQGQQVPVILRGEKAPYEIVSGFGRCEAIALAHAQGKLPEAFVWADVRAQLSDREAHEISVIENEDREGLSELDRTAKAKKLKEEGYSIAEICSVLKKGERMVQYYLSLAEAPARIGEALAQGRLRPTHALVLTRFAREALAELTPAEIEARLDTLIQRCAMGASVASLRAETASAPDQTRSPRYLVRADESAGTFELKGFDYSPSLPVEVQKAMLEALAEAQRTISRGLKKASSGA